MSGSRELSNYSSSSHRSHWNAVAAARAIGDASVVCGLQGCTRKKRRNSYPLVTCWTIAFSDYTMRRFLRANAKSRCKRVYQFDRLCEPYKMIINRNVMSLARRSLASQNFNRSLEIRKPIQSWYAALHFLDNSVGISDPGVYRSHDESGCFSYRYSMTAFCKLFCKSTETK